MRGVAEQPPREERSSLARRIALSYWTVILIGALILAVHARFWFSHPSARAENLSGLGAALIVLGLVVAARPFIRSGTHGLAMAQTQAPQFMGYADAEGILIAQARAAYDTRVERAKPDIVAERIIAVVVIAAGTLLNGYATPLVRMLNL